MRLTKKLIKFLEDVHGCDCTARSCHPAVDCPSRGTKHYTDYGFDEWLCDKCQVNHEDLLNTTNPNRGTK